MDETDKSFSGKRRFGLFATVVISVAALLALLAMVNYLGARHYVLLRWSAQSRAQLSARTLGLLKSLTNKVDVTIFYDKRDKLYPQVQSLLADYHAENPLITVRTVDYLLDAAEAVAIKNQYTNYFASAGPSKNLVIFSSGSRAKAIPGDLLGQYNYKTAQSEKQVDFQRELVAFNGEMVFSAAIFSVANPRVMKAYFVEGQHPPDSAEPNGYKTFQVAVLQDYNIQSALLDLSGTNLVPADCNLLVIAGPHRLLPAELDKIKSYLEAGGRLFALLSPQTHKDTIGLEQILADWGVAIGPLVLDPPNIPNGSAGKAMLVKDFRAEHPLSNPLFNSSGIYLVLPSAVSRRNPAKTGPEAPKVVELAYTSDKAVAITGPTNMQAVAHPVPMIAAVEKGSIRGIFAEPGTTRIVVVGDSYFLDNELIGQADNLNFALCAVNWLTDQTQLLKGIGPREVTENHLMMTHSQLSSVRWIFLVVMPGTILALGGLVWLKRRH